VQDGEDNLECRLLLDRMLVDGDAAAVVDDANATVGEEGDRDARGVAGECLVDGVVDDLVHEVMQAPFAGGSDVHAGALADGVKAFKNGDRAGVVRHGRRSSSITRGSLGRAPGNGT
jgi:hypothetical protein